MIKHSIDNALITARILGQNLPEKYTTRFNCYGCNTKFVIYNKSNHHSRTLTVPDAELRHSPEQVAQYLTDKILMEEQREVQRKETQHG